jgi:hypothetical protein
MNSNGSHQRALTEHTVNGNFDPQFSPDGSMIVFSRHPHGEPEFRQALFTMTAKGHHVHRITPWALQAGMPDWSPDGTRILFPSNRDVMGGVLLEAAPCVDSTPPLVLRSLGHRADGSGRNDRGEPPPPAGDSSSLCVSRSRRSGDLCELTDFYDRVAE